VLESIADNAELTSDPVRIGQTADTNGDVDPSVDEVDHRVIEQQMQAQLGRLRQYRRERDADMSSKADWRRACASSGEAVSRPPPTRGREWSG
jgi:hypothetical protein